MMESIVLLLSLLVSSVHARWMTIQEAGSVVEKYSLEYTVFKSGAWDQLTDYTVRVQADDAKVSASLFAIEYNSFTDKVEILEAYTENGKDKIPVEASAIEDRDKGKAKDYDALKVRSVAFPQVEVGSRLHIRYIVHTEKPVMKDRWSTEIALTPGVFIEKLSVKVKSEVPIYYEMRDPGRQVNLRQKNKFNVEVTNKKVIQGWVHAEKDPYFHPMRNTEIFISTHKEWPEYFSALDKDFAGVLAAPLPKVLQQLVLAAGEKKDVKEQIYFLMDRMSRDFRYFGDWRRHNGGLVPRSLAEIEKSRYGDCKDLSSVLASMLRALKIDANVALVRRGENPWGEEPDYKQPSLNRFNHAIVQVKSGLDTYWLDATNPVASLAPFPDVAGRPAWILQPGKGHFDRIPAAVASEFLHIREYDYQFKALDQVRVKVSAEMKGLAPFHTANELLLSPRSEVLSETLEYFSEAQEVRSFHYIKEPQTTRQIADMNIVLEYETGRVTFDAGRDGFFVIPDGLLGGVFYETTERESDMRLGEGPFIFRGQRRLKDTRLAQALPDPCKIESDWMNLERKIEVQGKDVVIYQNVELKKPVVTRDDFQSRAFKKLQKGTKECFYHSGILVGALKGSL